MTREQEQEVMLCLSAVVVPVLISTPSSYPAVKAKSRKKTE